MNNLSELMNDFVEKKISMEEYISKIESFEINDDALFNDFLKIKKCANRKQTHNRVCFSFFAHIFKSIFDFK